MSVSRLLLSGLLVASGLMLAAFTLHGSFDSRQMQASAAQGPALKPWSTNTFEAGGRLVATSADRLGRQQPRAQPARASLDSKAPGGKSAAAKAAAARAKRLAEKMRAEKRRLAEQAQSAKQQPQQAALQWPWNWFGN